MKGWWPLPLLASLAVAGANLLSPADLSEFTEDGLPLGYTAVTYVPRQNGELLPAEGMVIRTADDTVELSLPDDRNLRLDLTRPVELQEGCFYRLSVKLRWESLVPTGPGAGALGPGFMIYLHGTDSGNAHVMATIRPSGGSDGWVALELCVDPERLPGLQKARVFFRSHDITGRLWLKEAVLEEIPELPTPPTRFLLPNGETIAGNALAL